MPDADHTFYVFAGALRFPVKVLLLCDGEGEAAVLRREVALAIGPAR